MNLSDDLYALYLKSVAGQGTALSIEELEKFLANAPADRDYWLDRFRTGKPTPLTIEFFAEADALQDFLASGLVAPKFAAREIVHSLEEQTRKLRGDKPQRGG